MVSVRTAVMTLDWAEGLPLADNAALDAAGHDRQVQGARVLQLFLSHALRDGYFQADHAPGQPQSRGERRHHSL